MDWWKKIVGQNWPFYSHQGLYDMVKTDATGPGAVAGADESWARFAALMDESVEDVQQALAEAGASWEGLASESMTSAVAPLSQWAQDAGTAGTASGDGVRQVGESFAFTANAMPEPVKVTSTANSDTWGIPAVFTHVFGGQTDQDRQEREAQEAKQRAVDLMHGYSRNADSATSSLGTFVAPQSVTVSVPPQSFGGPPSHIEDSIEGPTGEPRGAGEPRQPGGPRGAGEPGNFGAPRGVGGPGEVSTPDPRSPNAVPVDVVSGLTDGGGQATTPGSANPVVRPPVAPPPGVEPFGGGPGGPPIGGFDPVTGLPIDQRTGRPFDPVSGRPIDPTTGRPVGAGPGGRPQGGGLPGTGGPGGDEPGRGGRGPGGGLPGAGAPDDGERGRGGRGAGADDGHRAAGRGGMAGSGPLEGERAAGGRGGGAGARAGAGGMGMGPMGAGARREEDQERYSPDFLRDYHDEFWDDRPPVAPPVIGEEDAPPPTGDGR